MVYLLFLPDPIFSKSLTAKTLLNFFLLSFNRSFGNNIPNPCLQKFYKQRLFLPQSLSNYSHSGLVHRQELFYRLHKCIVTVSERPSIQYQLSTMRKIPHIINNKLLQDKTAGHLLDRQRSFPFNIKIKQICVILRCHI